MDNNKRAKKTAQHTSNVILEPGQTLSDYNKLRKKWNNKLKQQNFFDIEHVNFNGTTSAFFRDYPISQIIRQFSVDKEEYWRRAGIFNEHFDFETLHEQINPTMARFLWRLWSEGHTMPEMVKAAKASRAPRIRYTNGKAEVPPSIFWIHSMLHQVLFPAFNAWCTSELNGLLAIDHDLEFRNG